MGGFPVPTFMKEDDQQEFPAANPRIYPQICTLALLCAEICLRGVCFTELVVKKWSKAMDNRNKTDNCFCAMRAVFKAS